MRTFTAMLLAVAVAFSATTVQASILDGTWGACNNTGVVVQGERYVHYMAGQPVDAGRLTLRQDGILTTYSEHGYGQTEYAAQYRPRSEILFLQEFDTERTVHKFYRANRPGYNRTRCESIF